MKNPLPAQSLARGDTDDQLFSELDKLNFAAEEIRTLAKQHRAVALHVELRRRFEESKANGTLTARDRVRFARAGCE